MTAPFSIEFYSRKEFVVTSWSEAKRNSFIIRSSHRDGSMVQIQVMGVRGLPLIHAGDPSAAMMSDWIPMQDGDILCIVSTIYSKAKGYAKLCSKRNGAINGRNLR